MRGCLRAIAVRIGCLLVVIAMLIAAIMFRKEIGDYYHAWRGRSFGSFVEPAVGGAKRARDAIGRIMRPSGPAYQDISAADLAALISDAIARSGQRRVFDSVRVALVENEIRVRGVLDLRDVPRNTLGPLAGMVGDHEPAAIGGPLSADSTGGLVLTVTYLTLRDFPFPKATIPRLLEAAHLPGVHDARLPIPGTSGIGDVRVGTTSVRLYKSAPR